MGLYSSRGVGGNMKRKTLMGLYGFLFMIMGPTFIVMGYFNKIGMLPTTQNSHGDPAIIFPIIGITFLVMGVILLYIEFYKQKEREKLITTGIKVQGTVTKVKKLSYIRVGKKTTVRKNSPYIIYFFYEYCGQEYDGQSQLIWEKPTISVGNIVTIWVDKHKAQHYFVKV